MSDYLECDRCSNTEMIPLFAAYCSEGGNQWELWSTIYTPYALFRRQGDSCIMTIVGKQLRPWLDGRHKSIHRRLALGLSHRECLLQAHREHTILTKLCGGLLWCENYLGYPSAFWNSVQFGSPILS